MRHFLLIVTLLAAKCAIPALSQCTCDKANMVTNQGTAQQNFTWAPITFTEANGGCDLIATCHGISPLSFGLYYSSTADGNSPIVDADNAATLTFEDGSEAGQIHNFEFKYMRCVNGDWMVYMDDSGYLAENDPSGDPTMWFAYNNLFCEQADIPVVSKFVYLIGSKTRESASFIHHCNILFAIKISFTFNMCKREYVGIRDKLD